MIFTELFVPTFTLGIAFAVVGFLLSRIFRRNDVADALWGLGFFVVAVWHAFPFQLSLRSMLAFSFVSLWSLRLSGHLALRILKSKDEDLRYREWRSQWGDSEPVMAFFKVFLLQGLILSLVAMPVVWLMRIDNPDLTPWDFAGAIIFLIGFVLEVVADAQLASFRAKASHRGKILRDGLWRWSRHPNYFGEILIWWGLFLMCMSLSGGILTVISPLLMTFLLTRVSGVPMLERLLSRRGSEYALYVNSTPALIPLRLHGLVVYAAIIGALFFLDLVWLGWIMGDFYKLQASMIARVEDGRWDVLAWAASGVYLMLAYGLQNLALESSRSMSIYRGAVFGLSVYAVYELTNLALVKNWPVKMALIDICWGTLLCSFAVGIGHWVKTWLNEREVSESNSAKSSTNANLG